MTVRLSNEELEMIRTVVHTAANIKDPLCVQVCTPRGSVENKYYVDSKVPEPLSAGYIRIKQPNGDWRIFNLPFYVPDIPPGEAGAAERMLVFMGLETHPTRPAEFIDYIGLAYEFAKNNRQP